MTQPQDTIKKILREHSLAVEKLTEDQLAEAIEQAIRAGDFVRYTNVMQTDQAVVYVPFAQVESLRAKNEKFKERLEELGAILHESQMKAANLALEVYRLNEENKWLKSETIGPKYPSEAR